MNRLNGSRAGGDRILTAHDVLRARSAAVLAVVDPAREHRLREIDGRVAAVRAEQLEPRLRDGRGCSDPPTHHGNVFLSAVNQLDILRGVRRRDEVQLPTTGDQQDGDEACASGRGARSARSGCEMAGYLLSRGVWKTLHGGFGKTLRGSFGDSSGPAAQKPKQEPCLSERGFRCCRAAYPSRLSLKFGKL